MRTRGRRSSFNFVCPTTRIFVFLVGTLLALALTLLPVSVTAAEVVDFTYTCNATQWQQQTTSSWLEVLEGNRLSFNSDIVVTKVACLEPSLQEEFIERGIKVGSFGSEMQQSVSSDEEDDDTAESSVYPPSEPAQFGFVEKCASECAVMLDYATEIYVATIFYIYSDTQIANGTCYCASSNTTTTTSSIDGTTTAGWVPFSGNNNSELSGMDECLGNGGASGPNSNFVSSVFYHVTYPCAPMGEYFASPCGTGCVRNRSTTGTGCCLPIPEPEVAAVPSFGTTAVWVFLASFTFLLVGMGLVWIYCGPQSEAAEGNGVEEFEEVGCWTRRWRSFFNTRPSAISANEPRLRNEAEAESLSEALLLGFPSGGKSPCAPGPLPPFRLNPLAYSSSSPPISPLRSTSLMEEMQASSLPGEPKEKRSTAEAITLGGSEYATCAVCLEILLGCDEKVLPCDHRMHKQCLRSYMTHHVRRYSELKCPVCKGPLLGGCGEHSKKKKNKNRKAEEEDEVKYSPRSARDEKGGIEDILL